MARQLNQILADTVTLGDLYKKSYGQVSGPTFDQLWTSLRKSTVLRPNRGSIRWSTRAFRVLFRDADDEE